MNKKLLTALQELQPGKWGELQIIQHMGQICSLNGEVINHEEIVRVKRLETQRREAIQGFYDICEKLAPPMRNMSGSAYYISAKNFKSLTGLSFDQVYEKIQEGE